VLVLVGADTSAAGRARLAAEIAGGLPSVLERLLTALAQWGRRDAGDGPPTGPPPGGGVGPVPAFGPPMHAAGSPAPAPGAGAHYGPPTGQGTHYGPPTGPGAHYGPPSGPGAHYGPPSGPGAHYGPPTGHSGTAPLPGGAPPSDPDVPQSWRPPTDPGSGPPPTYGPRG
jgi:hypothetical protein